MVLEISEPDLSKLDGHFILGEIIEHIGKIGDEFPNVDLEELIQQLTRMRSQKCNPEVQLRGFLKVFQYTPKYKEEYLKLDSRTQHQLHDFISGVSAADVVGQRNSLPPPSPPVKNHWKLWDSLRKLFARTEDTESLENRLRAAKVPMIYENEAHSELMEVSFRASYEDSTDLLNTNQYLC